MPDTFFSAPPHWGWLVVLYFFVGGIAGGAFFLAAILHLFGPAQYRHLVRTGYYVAFVGSILSGILLIIDLDKPLRFWHMFIASETGRPMFKYWSPISVGSWALLLFGLFAFLAALGVAHEEGRIRWKGARLFTRGPLASVVAIVGGIFGFFIAGYTGVLLTATNRPVWADSTWLGVLFVFSAASTAAAALILLTRRHVDSAATHRWLASFDRTALILELLALIVFLFAIGRAATVFTGWWGVLLAIMVAIGILVPLLIGFGVLSRWRNQPIAPATSASLVLAGGFLLRVVIVMSSESVIVAGNRVIAP